MALKDFEKEGPSGTVKGRVDERFFAVAEAFTANFETREEIGASCAATLEGETVIDLWGGSADPEKEKPWSEDTISVIFSCTKGAAALCTHMAVERGLIDLDAPVGDYWPEFATNGKEEAIVSMMLDHSAGVPHVREPIRQGGVSDFDYMAKRVAEEEAFWKPGTRNGYHGLTFAWTVGELFRRATGRPLGAFFQEEVAKPLGIDFWIGLPEEEEDRVATMIPTLPDPDAPPSKFLQAVMTDPASPSHLFLMNGGGMDFNSREWRAAEISAGNGISNARGLAGLYAPLANGGGLNGVTLLQPDTIARMSRVSMATHEDATLLIPARFGLGFMKSMDNRNLKDQVADSAILSDAAFGHVGMGGSIGFADPDEHLSFAYTMNRMGPGILLNERGQSLIDETYKALGYRSNASGFWEK